MTHWTESTQNTLTVREQTDPRGDIVYELTLMLYERKLIDELATRLRAGVVFRNDYRDYGRSEGV